MQSSTMGGGGQEAGLLPDLKGLTRAFLARHPDLAIESEELVLARLEARLPEISDRTLSEIRARIPAYQAVDDEEIAASVLRLISGVLAHARTADRPGRELLDPFEDHAQRRVFDGVPLAALLEAIHIGARKIIAAVDEELVRAGVPVEGMLEIHDLAWEWANGISSTVARLHGELEEQRLRRERARRTEFVRTLLLGTHRADRLRANAARFGLAIDRPYIPFCSRPLNRRDALDIASAILRTGADSGLAAVVETMDGDLVGLAPGRPHVTGHLVAIGEPLTLERVHESFADACAALDAAHAFSMTGTLALEDLGPRPLVVTAERAARHLERRMLAAFPEADEPHEIERTVLDYLDQDQDAEATARRLGIHVNTVRYRLGRFRELTGLDLRRTEDLVAVWWLLHRRAAARREALASGPRRPPAAMGGGEDDA